MNKYLISLITTSVVSAATGWIVSSKVHKKPNKENIGICAIDNDTGVVAVKIDVDVVSKGLKNGTYYITVENKKISLPANNDEEDIVQ